MNNIEYKFDWRQFTEDDYNCVINRELDDFVGSIRIGDISIELHVDFVEELSYDFYVAHEDTGYGHTDDGIPYDYICGGVLDLNKDLSYKQFKKYAENEFSDFIDFYNGNYSLKQHANKVLEIF